MGDDEMVRVRLARGVGERIVTAEVRKGDLKRNSPAAVLDLVLAQVSPDDRREVSLMKGLVSSENARTEVIDLTGERKLVPYDRPMGETYIQKLDGIQTLSLDYGTVYTKGNL